MLSGCSSIHEEASPSNSMFQNATFTSSTETFTSDLNGHVRKLVAEMAQNMDSIESVGPIAVTNFVFTNSDYQSTNKLGYALSDTFMMELHRFGFETLDFKVTDYIRITPQGDFAMSRDYLELQNDIAIDYVLVGKLTDYNNGYVVHARIVDINSKKILASGESFIPNKLVSRLINNKHIQKTDFTIKVTS